MQSLELFNILLCSDASEKNIYCDPIAISIFVLEVFPFLNIFQTCDLIIENTYLFSFSELIYFILY